MLIGHTYILKYVCELISLLIDVLSTTNFNIVLLFNTRTDDWGYVPACIDISSWVGSDDMPLWQPDDDVNDVNVGDTNHDNNDNGSDNDGYKKRMAIN